MPSGDPLTALQGFTFRRIANGGVKIRLLRAEDLQHLVELGFVVINEGRAVLSENGRLQFEKLQRTS